MKHYTIPFFIIHEGCPNQCVFCNQNNITGRDKVDPEEVYLKIETYLKTINTDNTTIEVGFFGGSFTALEKEYQESLLEPVQPYIKDKKINGIRLSTRPDYIDKEKLAYLQEMNVKCIELGVQSMRDNVLSIAKRGHTSKDVIESSRLILEKGFVLGHQIMVGLPQSREEDEYFTAKKVKEMGASEVRIYPVLVMKKTELAQRWEEDEYVPLTEEEALKRCAYIVLFFELNNIKLIRCGLHPSRGLLDGSGYLAGPFHPAFGEKVKSRLFGLYLKYIKINYPAVDTIEFNPKDKGAILGFAGANKDILKEIKVRLVQNDYIERGDLLLCLTDIKVVLNKKNIAREILPELLKPNI